MKRLDHGYLHPKLEVPGLTCPSRESNQDLHGGRRALQKRAIRTLFNNYSEHLQMSHKFFEDSKSCKADGLLPSRRLASPRVLNHGGVTTMKRRDHGHLHPKLEVPGLTCPGRESIPDLHGGRRALQKRAIRTHVNNYSEHL